LVRAKLEYYIALNGIYNDAPQNRKIGKPNNLNFESNKTKGPKHDPPNRLKEEGGEPRLVIGQNNTI
jgi:hypothetical protein